MEIFHPFLACILLPLHQESMPQQTYDLCCVCRSKLIALVINPWSLKSTKTARGTCFPSPVSRRSVERIVSSISRLVTKHMLVPLHSSFETEQRPMRFRLGCLPGPSDCRQFRLRIQSVSLNKFCLSNVDTLSLHFFHLHVFWGIDLWLFVDGFVGPFSQLFYSWDLGPIPWLFSFHFTIFKLFTRLGRRK